MSTIIALIAKNGIAVAADGRALRSDTELLTDTVTKIFELSPSSVCSFAGGVPSDEELQGFVDALSEEARVKHIANIEDITTRARQGLFDASIVNHRPGSGWLRDYTVESGVVLLIAGYDGNGPAIRIIQACDRWERQGRPPKPYTTIGAGMYLSNKILDAEYDENESLTKANVLVLKALYASYQTKVNFRGKDIAPVGGQAQLWNILPKGKVKKFTPKKIKSFYQPS